MGVNTNKREGMNLGFNIEKNRDGGKMRERERDGRETEGAGSEMRCENEGNTDR